MIKQYNLNLMILIIFIMRKNEYEYLWETTVFDSVLWTNTDKKLCFKTS